jgi:hypothetical protein
MIESDEEKQYVLHAEDEYSHAVINRDVRVINQLLADDYYYYNSSGELITKEFYLSALQSGIVKYKSIDYTGTRVRIYSNTAILTAELHEKGIYQDQEFNERFRITRIYIKQSGQKWLAVAGQLTRIGKKEEE